MNDVEKRAAATKFAERWKGRGYEKGESQVFWTTLLTKVYGIDDVDTFILFEEQVKLDHTSFIDGHIPSTHVLIEQKSIDKDLRKPIKQSDGTLLTPRDQAKRYSADLPYSQRPRWIVTCNFREFLIYDMERIRDEPDSVLLENLGTEYSRLNFLVDMGDTNIRKEMAVSLQAGEIVGVLYDALLKKYKNPNDPETLKNLNALCVRLVFCLYAEDAGVFGKRNMFYNYLSRFNARDARDALINLFRVLNQKPHERDEYLDDELAAFPYVNGGLFSDDNTVIPRLDENILDLLLHKASADFDWSQISPTIFGAVFESTLNPVTRRSGGMHYTSIENIHKVIDPLFLDDLREELDTIIARPKADAWRRRYLEAFKHKLASLRFLDPACGSGNFLTETYLSLRALENEVIKEFYQGVSGQMGLEIVDTDFMGIEVSISQFYGIEINDFAVTVARTALWIAESQMLKKTEDIVHMQLDFLPLKSYANITEGNALKLDWERVVPKKDLNYIMGNPPFVGKKEQSKVQKAELMAVFPAKAKGVGNLDYVTGWYMKALSLLKNTSIRAAFVSTNSITQGEQVPAFWNHLLNTGAHIDFAYRTFRWDSEASIKAHVHCVIIGFSVIRNEKMPRLYYSERRSEKVHNISPYLVDAPSIIVSSRSKPVCNVPPVSYGSMPIDNGHLILSKEDVDALLKENPKNAKFIRKYAGGVELIQGKDRWCLWLENASPREIQQSKIITERIRATAEFRKSSDRPQTLALADTPALFGEIRQPNTTMLVIPKVSSESRQYIPISYVSPEIIINGSALVIPNANLYHFGVLISNIHMAWMRAVAGRMKSDYQYSGNVVYNNFPWPNPTPVQHSKIEHTARMILDSRTRHSDCSLAVLYKNPGEGGMPPDLLEAHRRNDKAVWQAYGKMWDIGSESACVAELMKMYQELTKN